MEKVDMGMNRYQKELQNIKKLGRVEANQIKVVEKNDHKNISLWTKDGKRIGPLHPHNAERTLDLFWNKMGIELTAIQPTLAQIEEYKNTDEYKKKMAGLKASRDLKEKSRGKGKMDEYMKKIAEMSGQTVEAIHNIVKSAKDVKPLSEGRK